MHPGQGARHPGALGERDGYSPASIGATIAGLVAAAEIAERNGASDDAARYRGFADAWRAQLDEWTVTTTGPLSTSPYFLRLSVDGDADAPTMYELADGGPTIDQRAVVDTSFLELVRLGVRRADDPAVVQTLPVVDRELAVDTPSGRFWHRYSHDGYGETADGGPFGVGDNQDHGIGRAWPIFAGERGEYELAAGELSGATRAARAAAHERLDAIAATAGDGLMLPEQVWDDRPPAGAAGLPARQGHGVGDAAGLDARAVRPARLVDRRGPAGRAPGRGELPLRRPVPLRGQESRGR